MFINNKNFEEESYEIKRILEELNEEQWVDISGGEVLETNKNFTSTTLNVKSDMVGIAVE